MSLILQSNSINADKIHWQKAQYLQHAFQEIALRNEYTRRGHVVRKWTKPVTIWIDHQVGDQAMHTELVSLHLNHLQSLTSHPIKLTRDRKSANLRLIFTRQADWGQQVKKLFGPEAAAALHGAVCMANFRTNGHYEIIEARVIIPVDQARMHGKLVSCIVEELTQVMGLPNDSEAVYPSIFNDKTPEELLSGLDGLLLKMLYHPEIKPGMNEQQVRPVLKKIIHKWQQNGTITSAAKTVRRGALYPLLGY